MRRLFRRLSQVLELGATTFSSPTAATPSAGSGKDKQLFHGTAGFHLTTALGLATLETIPKALEPTNDCLAARAARGRWARRAERGDRVGDEVEHKECADGAYVDATDGRDDPTEEVEVHVRDCEQWLKERNTLRLGEPREQDAQRDQPRVDAEEVEASV
eukprot:CAMPEP_0195588828 /NCGR_PEP_ID=MMETSP0814-20130614/33285_1 /TAXON_ID=97485 /ORGANISM="Prymnesium parvum, Strain Texoma1" /LENGTH=159 /DNA_ID=CAMNT_0040727837 /DNA_START=74 /DNA_END=550 /DNA_ORIENTATION=+